MFTAKKAISRTIRTAAAALAALLVAAQFFGCALFGRSSAKTDCQPKGGPAAETLAEPGLPYYLYYEKGSYTLTIYGVGDDGYYSKVIGSYRTAHGGNKTPAGTFTLGARERWHGWEKSYAQFATLYYGTELYVHSPLYHSMDPNDLWESYYDGAHGIGGDNSGGCLRMVTEAARFIYENCPEGTKLTIVNGSPLGTTSDPVPDRHGKLYDPTDITAKTMKRK